MNHDVRLSKTVSETINKVLGSDETSEGMRCIVSCDPKYDSADQVLADIPSEVVQKRRRLEFGGQSMHWHSERHEFAPWVVQILYVDNREAGYGELHIADYMDRDYYISETVPVILTCIVDKAEGALDVTYDITMIDRNVIVATVYRVLRYFGW